jgi:hypothetical protein
MARYWWDDEHLRARAAGPVNVRFLALVLVALMTLSATSGAYALTAESHPVTAPSRTP